MITPVVVDVNEDDIPDVVANFFRAEDGFGGRARMRAISGRDGTLLWTTAETSSLDVRGTVGIAAGRLRPGGPVVLVTEHRLGQYLVAVDGRTGQWLWDGLNADSELVPCSLEWGTPAIADLEGDGAAEVLCGFTVFDDTGRLKWAAETKAEGPHGPISIVADIDGDRRLDISDGVRHYRGDGSSLNVAGSEPGFGAIADISGPEGMPDGWPDQVTVIGQQLRLRVTRGALSSAQLQTRSGDTCGPGRPQSSAEGGAPSVGDLDGDGRPEIVVANGGCLTAFTAEPVAAILPVAWSVPIIDSTSNQTSVALFDLDGDGSKDVFHGDEHQVRAVRGRDGHTWWTLETCSGTTYESPVLADVDGDGEANLIVASNTYAGLLIGCDPGFRPGIRAYRSRNGNWANARPVWNQHAYVPALVCDGRDALCPNGPDTAGAIPTAPVPFQPIPGQSGASGDNAFRSNSHGEGGPFASPRLVISHLKAETATCPRVRWTARIENRGTRTARPGTVVEFNRVAAVEKVGEVTLERALPPGGVDWVSWELDQIAGAKVELSARIVDQTCTDDLPALASASCP